MPCGPSVTRAVLDSSVVVGAFLKGDGQPARLLVLARAGAVTLCLSDYIIEETASVLGRPRHRRFGFAASEVARFRAGLHAVAAIVTSLPAVRADFLVTGDRRHPLPLGGYQGIRIITPRQPADLRAG
jgi:predicted nucleic acid-binding protein